MKKSSSVAAPFLACAALALLGGGPLQAGKRGRISSSMRAAMLRISDTTSQEDSTGTVLRGGFGSWFLIAAIAGVAIAFGVGE